MNERRVKYQQTGREKELFYTLLTLSSFTSFFFSDKLYTSKASFFFVFFFIEHLSPLLEIIYRVEHVDIYIYIHLHSFFMITHHLLTPASNKYPFYLIHSRNCRYVFSESTLPRRQIPKYRLYIYIYIYTINDCKEKARISFFYMHCISSFV